jgi:chromosome segregation ATPase
MANNVLLLTDGRRELRTELKSRRNELETLSQLLHRLEEEYGDLKRRYQTIDKEWALRDGRLKVVTAEPRPKKEKKLTQEEVEQLIEELSKMV